ncbi:hypothetical protein B7994_09970 [Fibrobacter sp. UWR2]|nr:hypothetical protein B7994_09970 [Fibrobacter sp. UWR2]
MRSSSARDNVGLGDVEGFVAGVGSLEEQPRIAKKAIRGKDILEKGTRFIIVKKSKSSYCKSQVRTSPKSPICLVFQGKGDNPYEKVQAFVRPALNTEGEL